jgi:hypothetical protein
MRQKSECPVIGDYETLIQRRCIRAMIDDQAIAKDTVEKAEEGA